MQIYKLAYSIVLITGIISLTACSNLVPPSEDFVIETPPSRVPPVPSISASSPAESLCFNFITHQMLANGGVRTNYLDVPFEPLFATGEEVLSESQGLLMEYAARHQNAELFASLYRFTMKNLDNGTSISYRYTPSTSTIYSVNAAIDDLRIIKSLMLGSVTLAEPYYLDVALKLANRFYKTNVSEDYLYDFYDNDLKLRNNSITLCYNDFYTLMELGKTNNKWLKLSKNMLNLVKGGYISDEFPLFYPRYDYDRKSYEHPEAISMIESLVTIYHLAEVNECPETTLAYLNDLLDEGTIYANYYLDGTPSSSIESTAIYALCARIGSLSGDQGLYQKSIDKMNTFQIQDQNSPIYGAFGNPTTYEAFSFDNLMALLAYKGRVTP